MLCTIVVIACFLNIFGQVVAEVNVQSVCNLVEDYTCHVLKYGYRFKINLVHYNTPYLPLICLCFSTSSL